MSELTLQLDSPITDEQWDAIADVNFEHTHNIWFHTKSGKDVEFVKVIRCKDCAYYDKDYSDELSDWCHVWSETTQYDGYCHEAEPYKEE